MAERVFPQLSTGALVQFPFKKSRMERTITNLLPDGNLILLPDPYASPTEWQLEYAGLSASEVGAIRQLFQDCRGRLMPFTFIDPTGNMLSSSSDLASSAWNVSNQITTELQADGPTSESSAITVTNIGQTPEEITQAVPIPSSYHCCFSVYGRSYQPDSIVLFRRSLTHEASEIVNIGPQWLRISTSGRLPESGLGLTVGLRLNPGQQLRLYGLQLEAQVSPSAYKPTGEGSAVCRSAYWAMNELAISADGPGTFSTSLSIEVSE